MALAHDAHSSPGATSTTDMSWTHTPVGVPKGVYVAIVQNVGVTDEVVGVTYGGVAMTEVPLSPLVQSFGAEDGVVYGFFLGSGVPTGAQTVVVDVNATASAKGALAVTVVADGDTAVENTSTLVSASVANPAVTLTTTVETVIYGALHSGHQTLPDISAGSGYTTILENDFGLQTCSFQRRTANAAAGSPTCGWTQTAEDAGVLAVAIKGVAGSALGAFPEVVTEAATALGVTASYVVNLPAGIVAGDGLLVAISHDGAATFTWPGGWTEVIDEAAALGSNCSLGVGYRIATGSEGATVTVTTSVADDGVARAFRIVGNHASQAPAASTVAAAVTASPNPGSLDPAGWDVEKTLWVAICAYGDGSRTVSAYPAGYTGGTQQQTGGSGGSGLAVARRANKGASDDPGAFTLSGSATCLSAVVAIRPSTQVGGASILVKQGGVFVGRPLMVKQP